MFLESKYLDCKDCRTLGIVMHANECTTNIFTFAKDCCGEQINVVAFAYTNLYFVIIT